MLANYEGRGCKGVCCGLWVVLAVALACTSESSVCIGVLHSASSETAVQAARQRKKVGASVQDLRQTLEVIFSRLTQVVAAMTK